ncbi:hypothetical protein MHH28_13615 [Paenibacillus sp. FSL K6-1217]|uniref:hypothetical protein n=1 Tax=Paenibacillus sp. FSL K6-1217 TaxID=2921466 RepID=UPI003245E5F5
MRMWTARTLGIKAGDTMDIYIGGAKHTLNVTGIYKTITNMSNSGRITADVIVRYSPYLCS